MAHTTENKDKLLLRVRRIVGQLKAVESALDEEKDCSEVLHTLVASRGALNSLIAEVLEGHVRSHILDPDHKHSPDQEKAAEEVIEVIRRYLK